jgi:hypothetical protein
VEHGGSQHICIDLEVTAQGVAERIDSSGRQRDHEIDVVGCSWFALEGTGQASTKEILRADGGQRGGDLERDIDRVLTDFSRHRARRPGTDAQRPRGRTGAAPVVRGPRLYGHRDPQLE